VAGFQWPTEQSRLSAIFVSSWTFVCL